jgi:hypothetical protein
LVTAYAFYGDDVTGLNLVFNVDRTQCFRLENGAMIRTVAIWWGCSVISSDQLPTWNLLKSSSIAVHNLADTGW